MRGLDLRQLGPVAFDHRLQLGELPRDTQPGTA